MNASSQPIRFPRWFWIFDFGVTAQTGRRMPGYLPLAGTSATIVVAAIAGHRLRMPWEWIVGIVSILDVSVTLHALQRGIGRLRRGGLFGPTRGWWWIEVAALTATVMGACLVFVLTEIVTGGAAPGWPQQVFELANQAIKPLHQGTLLLAIVGFLLGLWNRERPSGSGLELTVVVFWTSVLHWGTYHIPWSWTATYCLIGFLALLAVAMLAWAGVLRWRAPPDDPSGYEPPTPTGMPSPLIPTAPQRPLQAELSEVGKASTS